MNTSPQITLTLGAAERRLLTRAVRTLRQAAEQRQDYEPPVESQRMPQAAPLAEWSRRYLPHYFTLPPSDLHRWLFELCDKSVHSRRMKVNCVGPRDSAKSTVVTTGHVLREAVEGRESLIWIVGETDKLAENHLRHLQAELDGNQALARDYPDAVGRGPVWRQDKLRLRNGVAIEAVGKGSAIRGKRERHERPTLIVCDDLQSNNVAESTDRRQNDWNWFTGTLLKAGSPRTNVFNLANAVHREAIGMRLENTAGWQSRVYPSIVKWPDDMKAWAEWEAIYSQPATINPRAIEDARAFFEARQEQMEAGAVLLWPERFGLYDLMCMRCEEGHQSFEREKQSRPINPESCEWPEHYFDKHIWFDEWPKEYTLRVVALDPSKGKDSRRGDYSSFCLLQVTRGVLYFDFNMARRPSPVIVSDGVELVKSFRPNGFGVESVQFQELLGQDFLEAFERANLIETSPYLIGNTVSKQVRIRTLGPFLSQNRFRIRNTPGSMLALEQFRDFPDPKSHDDGPDSAEMAVRLANHLLFGQADGISMPSTLNHA
jgi:hypothetical protein